MSRREKNYPAALRSQAVRMVVAARADHPSEASAIRAVAEELGIRSPESVRQWVRRAEIDQGMRPGTTSGAAAEARARRRAAAEAARAVEILAAAAPLLRDGKRPPTARLVAFITQTAGRRTAGLGWSVEAICAVLSTHGAPISPSTYYAARAARPTASQIRDEYLLVKIAEVRAEYGPRYGARRVWTVLNERGIGVARCTVERLLRELPAWEDRPDAERPGYARRLAG
ncbi:MAG TPA: IS3 family transposase [Sporichthya sp.]|nr:IS3 family transposase [Sporichthya sp.]